MYVCMYSKVHDGRHRRKRAQAHVKQLGFVGAYTRFWQSGHRWSGKVDRFTRAHAHVIKVTEFARAHTHVRLTNLHDHAHM